MTNRSTFGLGPVLGHPQNMMNRSRFGFGPVIWARAWTPTKHDEPEHIWTWARVWTPTKHDEPEQVWIWARDLGPCLDTHKT
jgi:hypothetical protein